MVFQKPNPFPLSIFANLELPLREHGDNESDTINRKIEQALRDVGLWDEVKDRLKTSAQGLSGGQQQRLCIARALVLAPEAILFDEPCSALDPIASGVVEDLIASMRHKLTVIMVTHHLAQARRIADDLVVFWWFDGAGTVIESGPVDQLFENASDETASKYLRGLRG